MSFKTQQQLKDILKMISITEETIKEIKADMLVDSRDKPQQIIGCYQFMSKEIKKKIKS